MKHVIRNKLGGERKVDLNPIRAIRYFCLECMGHRPGQVRTCSDQLCALWPYRMGKDPGRERAVKLGLVEPEEGEPEAPENEAETPGPEPGLFDK